MTLLSLVSTQSEEPITNEQTLQFYKYEVPTILKFVKEKTEWSRLEGRGERDASV